MTEPKKKRRSKRRRILFILLLVGIVFLVCGIIAEFAIRAIHPQFDPNRRPSYVLVPDVLGDLEPNQNLPGGGLMPKFPIDWSTNEHGLRGTEPITSNDPRDRILFLGDSFMEGVLVSDRETLPAMVQKALKERGHDTLCINAGVSGYTMADHLGYYLDRGVHLKPDRVVVGFTQNDFSDCSRQPPAREAKLARMRDGSYRIRRVLRRSALLQYLNSLRTGGGGAQVADVHIREGPVIPPGSEAKYAADLSNLKAALAKEEIPLVGVIFCGPESMEENADAKKILDAARVIFDSAGVPTVDAHSLYIQSGHPAEKLFGLPHDTHPVELGYQVLVDPLMKLILER